MNWEHTSVTKEAYYKMLSTIQIKNDCETLKALSPVISQPIIILGMLPYLSLFCCSVQEYLNDNIMPAAIENSSPFKISDIRSKLKLFNDRYGKSQKQILLSDDQQDQRFRGELRFPWTRGLNIHYNLGIYCDEEGHIICNTQYVHSMFQDKTFSQSLQDPNEVRSFGEVIGTTINSVCTGLEVFLPGHCVSVNSREFKIKYKDFNTNRSFNLFSQIKSGKEVTLRLLHILSAVNFLRYVIMRIVDSENIWQLRVSYITLYYAIKSIEKLISVLDTGNHDETKISQSLKDCLPFEDDLFDSEFRSCMMHYGFYNNGKWAIDDKYLDVQVPFFGLVESRFNGCSFTKYSSLLSDKLIKLSGALTAMLQFDMSGLREL